MVEKLIPLMAHADETGLRSALEVAFNCGVSEGLSEARGMIKGARPPNGAAEEPK